MATSTKIAEKRIPVSVEVWSALHNMRKPGQTYDNLLREMIPEYERRAIPDYGDIIIIDPAVEKE